VEGYVGAEYSKDGELQLLSDIALLVARILLDSEKLISTRNIVWHLTMLQ
jgi:hypothetical protein